MKKSLQISLKDKSVIILDAIVKTTYEPLIKVEEILEQKDSPILLLIQHHQLNTLLELSEVSPYVLLYFDTEYFFFWSSIQYKSLWWSFQYSNPKQEHFANSAIYQI